MFMHDIFYVWTLLYRRVIKNNISNKILFWGSVSQYKHIEMVGFFLSLKKTIKITYKTRLWMITNFIDHRLRN